MTKPYFIYDSRYELSRYCVVEGMRYIITAGHCKLELTREEIVILRLKYSDLRIKETADCYWIHKGSNSREELVDMLNTIRSPKYE